MFLRSIHLNCISLHALTFQKLPTFIRVQMFQAGLLECETDAFPWKQSATRS
jgi:hypothetical protein